MRFNSESERKNFEDALSDVLDSIEKYKIEHRLTVEELCKELNTYDNHYYELRKFKSNPTLKRIACMASYLNKKLKISFV